MRDLLLTASIVIYKYDEKATETINSFLKMPVPVRLYLVDNSPDDSFIRLNHYLTKDERVIYIFNNKNLGYGSAHNIALKKVMDKSSYHLVLNPDIEFNHDALAASISYMEQNNDIGLLMPKIVYPDGSIQYLCKMLPAPFDLIMRRFIPGLLQKTIKQRLDQYELRHKDYDTIMDVPNLSGCFMLMRCEVLKTVGIFDERFFMYLEDTDLCRRIGEVSRTVYYPEAVVFHGYAKASYKNLRLLKHHISSAIKYFNKWGWFWDSGRSEVNRKLK